MRIHSVLGPAVLLIGLLLGACDSSSTSPTPNPNGHGTAPLKPSGTLTLPGREYPVYVGGTYDKDSMMMIIKTDLRSDTSHTGWNFVLYTVPGQGKRVIANDTFPLPRNIAYYQLDSNQPAACIYRLDEEWVRIDSWTVVSAGKSGTAKMSGGASMILNPIGTTLGCDNLTAELTFTDAEAAYAPAAGKTAAHVLSGG